MRALDGRSVATGVPLAKGMATGPYFLERRVEQDIVTCLDAILRATDMETVWALICRFLQSRGFDGVIYGYSPQTSGANLGSREDFLLLSTLDREFMQELVDRGYYSESVTFNWALENIGIASWKMTAEDAEFENFQSSPEALAFFQRFGMVAGCTIGFPPGRARGRAVMALVAGGGRSQDEVDALLERLGREIFVATTVAHRSLTNFPYLDDKRSLTRRQREVLEWVAEGKSVADVARILDIAQPTVEKHLRLARETLGVATTAHAVIKATLLNQMFMIEPSGRLRAV